MKKFVVTFFVLACLASAQDALTNDSIVKMVNAGLAENLILTMVQNQPGKYSMTPDELVKLKGLGVSDRVMAAMMAKASGAASAPVAGPNATPVASMDTDLPTNADIGAYFKKDGKWEEMLPEVVNWKTGGVIKNIATVGVVKGDVNGHIPSAHSRNSAKSPV